jgi:hypothetical protein
MEKKTKIFIGILIILVIGLIFNQSNKPKKIDWRPSFNKNHKRPWGTYVLYKELKYTLATNSVISINKTPYEQLRFDYDYNAKSNYIFINNKLTIDGESTNELLNYVSYGNTVFLAGQVFSKALRDTLHFKTEIKLFNKYTSNNEDEDDDETANNEIALYFSNKTLNPKKYFYEKGVAQCYFKALDSLNTTVLGYNNLDGEEKINFIKIQYGEGFFYLNTQPYTFTNYHLLKENHADYVASLLSYIPENTKLYWDANTKADKETINSPLRFIFSNPALAWAWRLAILGLMIFAIFLAKRRQRIIPIIKPLENTTIAFAKTIGELYYEEGEPKDILFKKINYFLAFVREKYLIDTERIDDNLIKKLHLKSGVPEENIKKLIYHIIYINKKHINTENDIVVLNKLIEKFHKKIKL